ncbi:hypothetical protein WAI453_008565 [Rhynchosporium graminicola]
MGIFENCRLFGSILERGLLPCEARKHEISASNTPIAMRQWFIGTEAHHAGRVQPQLARKTSLRQSPSTMSLSEILYDCFNLLEACSRHLHVVPWSDWLG